MATIKKVIKKTLGKQVVATAFEAAFHKVTVTREASLLVTADLACGFAGGGQIHSRLPGVLSACTASGAHHA
ncbi:hypothetical protein [Cobetia sp. L2A1]|uniref:hypothetical protein n=1 Tax=Cobetia sp. L2A1 TaxID=2686360 RepID=UPI00131EC7F5|nr:hypothetical protein [Cobetia sp. L2A1]